MALMLAGVDAAGKRTDVGEKGSVPLDQFNAAQFRLDVHDCRLIPEERDDRLGIKDGQRRLRRSADDLLAAHELGVNP